MSGAEKFWDKSAEKYSKSKISDPVSYQKKLAETQRLFRPSMRVLEFGCGTASTAIAHAPFVKHIDAIDIAENMLAIGRDKARSAGIDNITFTHGSLSDFNAANSSVDVVLGMSVLQLLPDRESTLIEVERILKPGGYFVSSTACLGNSLLRFIKLIAPIAKILGLMPEFFVLTEKELADEIAGAGFEIQQQWHHGSGGMTVFIIARKIALNYQYNAVSA